MPGKRKGRPSVSRIRFGHGVVAELAQQLNDWDVRSLLLVTGRDSFRRSGAEAALSAALRGRVVTRFADFSANPDWSDALRGLEICRRHSCDAVLAVGGGSTIDMAKLIRGLVRCDGDAEAVVRGRAAPPLDGPRLVVVPTTAGSGSEATHFAVVYLDGVKFSVAAAHWRPDLSLVDPRLTYSMSPQLTAVTGLDALCQGMESYWSVQATERSRHFARQAVRLAWKNLADAVNRPSRGNRAAMSAAALRAGEAINISKTTAPHALSYTMTSQFGVPHGHAVALTVGELMVFNSQVDEGDACDPRGAMAVRETMAQLAGMLRCRDVRECRDRLRELLSQLGLATRLQDVGIRTPADLQQIVRGVNPQRLKNNPRCLDTETLSQVVSRVA